MSRIVKIMTLLSALLLPGAAVHGHAFLDHASPLVGSTVATPPRELVLWFTEKLEPAFSTIEVRNAQGVAMQSGKAHLDRTDAPQLRVWLRALPGGSYQVIWRVL